MLTQEIERETIKFLTNTSLETSANTLNYKIIICIPAYNEEKNIVQVIKEINTIMKRTNYNFKIIVLNDGSEDDTKKLALSNGAYVFSNKKNLGLADTFRNEMKICQKLKPDVIVHTDADGQYPAIYIPYMIRKVIEGYDLVLGSRFGRGIYSGRLSKKIGNLMFAKLFSIILFKNIYDTTTGFRAFNQEVGSLPIKNKFTYTQEQLIRAIKAGKKVREVPIKARKTRNSKLFGNVFEYFLRVVKNFSNLFF